MILVENPLAESVHFHHLLSITSPQIRKGGIDCFQVMLLFWSWGEVRAAGQGTLAEDLMVRSVLNGNTS